MLRRNAFNRVSGPERWPVLVWALLLALIGCGQTWGQNLPAAGDRQGLWLVQNDAQNQRFRVVYLDSDSMDQHLQPASALRGQLLGEYLASSGGRLWMIYSNHYVQSINAIEQLQTRRTFFKTRTEPQLPRGVEVRATAAEPGGFWVLLQVRTREALDWIDGRGPMQAAAGAEPTAARARRRSESPAAAASSEDRTATQQSAAETADAGSENAAGDDDSNAAEAASPAQAGEDAAPSGTAGTQLEQATWRLLHLANGRWSQVDLPADFVPTDGVWMVAPGEQRGLPMLLASEGGQLRTWRLRQLPARGGQPTAADWLSRTHEIEIKPDARVAQLDQQVVLAQPQSGADGVQLQLAVIRPEGVNQLGALSLAGPVEDWAFTQAGSWLAVVGQVGPFSYRWSRIDLLASSGGQDMALQEQPRSLWPGAANIVVLVVALGVATLVMLVFWRRDPETNRLELPPALALSDFGRRIAAGLIDLLPCVLLAMAIYQLDLGQIIRSWPGRGDSLSAMEPGVVAILLFVLHSLAAEAVWGRSLGKMLMGIHVSDLKGARPQFWQILVRNVMKIFDLLAFPLLIMPLIGPYRQRLGDLVARTVVVSAAPPEPELDDFDE